MCAAASRGSVAENYKHISIQFKYSTVKLPYFKCFLLLKFFGVYYFISPSAVENCVFIEQFWSKGSWTAFDIETGKNRQDRKKTNIFNFLTLTWHSFPFSLDLKFFKKNLVDFFFILYHYNITSKCIFVQSYISSLVE